MTPSRNQFQCQQPQSKKTKQAKKNNFWSQPSTTSFEKKVVSKEIGQVVNKQDTKKNVSDQLSLATLEKVANKQGNLDKRWKNDTKKIVRSTQPDILQESRK